MSGRERIESLTHSWYGFSVFSAAAVLLERGLGVFSFILGGIGLAFSFFVTWLIGRSLLGRSSLTRLLCLVVSLVAGLFAASNTVRLTGSLLHNFSLTAILEIALSAAYVAINIQSFRTLIDKQVKAYFA